MGASGGRVGPAVTAHGESLEVVDATQVSGKTTKRMERAKSSGQMVPDIREAIRVTRGTGRVVSRGQMVRAMTVNGRRTACTARVSTHGAIDGPTMESMRTI